MFCCEATQEEVQDEDDVEEEVVSSDNEEGDTPKDLPALPAPHDSMDRMDSEYGDICGPSGSWSPEPDPPAEPCEEAAEPILLSSPEGCSSPCPAPLPPGEDSLFDRKDDDKGKAESMEAVVASEEKDETEEKEEEELKSAGSRDVPGMTLQGGKMEIDTTKPKKTQIFGPEDSEKERLKRLNKLLQDAKRLRNAKMLGGLSMLKIELQVLPTQVLFKFPLPFLPQVFPCQ